MQLKELCAILVSLAFYVAESSNQNDGVLRVEIPSFKVISDYFITEDKNVRKTSESLEFLHLASSCNCGSNSFCELDIYGKKACTCNPGYGYKSGICELCNCGLDINCTFDKNNKYCHCPVEYGDYDGFCKACDCGRGANCTFESDGMRYCECPKGYELDHGKCEDIDECQNTTLYPCYAPHWRTKCRNIEGSYRCDCFLGYGFFENSELEPEEEHCQSYVNRAQVAMITSCCIICFFILAVIVTVTYSKIVKFKRSRGMEIDPPIAYIKKDPDSVL